MDADTDSNANADEEGEARKGGDVGEEEEFIGRVRDDTVTVEGWHGRGGAEG